MTAALHRKALICASLIVALVGTRSARADEVWLLNGDSLSGTAQTLESGVLTFRTPFNDVIRVPWKEVAGLETVRRVRVTVRGIGSHVGRVVPGPEGCLRLQTAAGPSLDIRLPDIMMIVRPQVGVMTMGRAEAGLLIASGSSDISSLHLTGEINWRTLSTRTSADIAVNRAQTFGIETASNLTSTFRHQQFLTDHVYANGNVILTNDRFRDVTLRMAPGVGVGYQFAQFPVTTLSLDGGFGYVSEHHAVEPDRNYWAVRETVKYEHFVVPTRLQLFHQHDGYFGLGDNWFVRTRSGLHIILTGGLIMTGELGLNYDRRPPLGQDHIDRTFAITLGYQLGY
jgi:putative salt-induced outer membrane protein YdiY